MTALCRIESVPASLLSRYILHSNRIRKVSNVLPDKIRRIYNNKTWNHYSSQLRTKPSHCIF